MKSIYDLDLHEKAKLDDTTVVTKVPGGWIYKYLGIGNVEAVFVPFSPEFQGDA